MKKIYSLLFIAAAAATSFPAMAQQLPNAGFEEGQEACIPWTSNNNTTKQGTNPKGWISGNTIGTGNLGKVTVISFVTGNNSETAVKATNTEYNAVVTKKTIPGYFALGTPWSTSKGTGSNMDGGTFGGIDFSYRPDALSFYYQSATDTDKPTVVAYTWKGHWTQTNVPANIVISGSPTSIDMTDRDRNILGIETSQGGDVTHTDDAALVSVINQRLNATTISWTYSELDFEYKNNANPEQINVIFGAGDYFNVSPIKNNSVTVDDIRLLYFSRLKSLSINGTPISNFDSKTYTYDLSETEMPDASAITYELLSNSGSSAATISINDQEATATITVTNNNNGGTDYDDLASHTYTIQFKKKTDVKPEWGGIVYDGTVTIDGSNAGLGDETMDIPGQVHIIDNEDGTCTFVLPNFSLGEGFELGDIIVENVSKTADNPSETTAGAKYTYNGFVRHLQLHNDLLGDIIANVTIEGTTENGIATMQIHVNWLTDPENDPEGTTDVALIEVLFNGKNNELAGIGDISVDNNNTDAPIEYFNLEGMRVSGENLAPGIYIRRQGTDVKKILVK